MRPDVRFTSFIITMALVLLLAPISRAQTYLTMVRDGTPQSGSLSGSNSTSVALPVGVSDGDVVLVGSCIKASSSSMSISGWTQINSEIYGSASSMEAWGKIWHTGDPTTVSAVWSVTGDGTWGSIAYTNPDPSLTVPSAKSSFSGTVASTAGVNRTTASDMEVFFYCAEDNTVVFSNPTANGGQPAPNAIWIQANGSAQESFSFTDRLPTAPFTNFGIQESLSPGSGGGTLDISLKPATSPTPTPTPTTTATPTPTATSTAGNSVYMSQGAGRNPLYVNVPGCSYGENYARGLPGVWSCVPTPTGTATRTATATPTATVSATPTATATPAGNGIVRVDSGAVSVAELSQDGTTSGSNVLTITKAGNGTGNFQAGSIGIGETASGSTGEIRGLRNSNGTYQNTFQNQNAGSSATTRWILENDQTSKLQLILASLAGGEQATLYTDASGGLALDNESSGAIHFQLSAVDKWLIGPTTGGLYSANATGGNKGADSLNLKTLFFDGTAPGGSCSGTTPFVKSLSSSAVPTCMSTGEAPTMFSEILAGSAPFLSLQGLSNSIPKISFKNASATSHWSLQESILPGGGQDDLKIVNDVTTDVTFDLSSFDESLTIFGGGIVSGGPTGGAKGTGTYNGTAYEVNGVIIPFPINVHTISGATPTTVVTSATVATTDVENLVLSANVTTLALPAAAAVADHEILHYGIRQSASGGPWTLPAGTVGPLTAGSGTIVSDDTGGSSCTIGSTQSATVPSELHMDVIYYGPLTEWIVMSCNKLR